ncbi:MAG: hypothetical protein U5O69_07655 [Candidatus Competibacteraceae bacterium]|nr:hypothetical protein [Candidatus Competibacteraceae bacterium]
MKLRHIWRGSTLTVVLCLGCATPAPDAGPDLVALEARLAVLDTRLERLERLEQSVAELWQDRRRQEVAHDQTLAGINRDLKDTRRAVAGLRRKVETPTPARAAAHGAGADYRPVDVVLGPLPSGDDGPLKYPIPAAIPDTAREILVYAQVATGYVEGGPHRFRIATRLDDGRETAFYLYAVGGSQQSWAYNSDNVWLPMPKNRELLLQTAGKAFFGDWNSEVRITAYR